MINLITISIAFVLLLLLHMLLLVLEVLKSVHYLIIQADDIRDSKRVNTTLPNLRLMSHDYVLTLRVDKPAS